MEQGSGESKAEEVGRAEEVEEELRCLLARHLLNTSLDTKECTQHPVGEIKYIHMKTTRTQTTYETDE